MKDALKYLHSPSGSYAELQKMRSNWSARGLDLPWPQANQFMSLKKGYPIFFGGLAHSGKTDSGAFEIPLCAAMMHNWRSVILSPETGSPEEIMIQLIEKISGGKDFSARSQNAIPASELEKLITWLDRHFRFLDFESTTDMHGSRKMNMRSIFEVVDAAEKEIGESFDMVIIDPFNELDLDQSSGSGIAGQVKDDLEILIRWTKRNNYVTILTNHANAERKILDKDRVGVKFYYHAKPALEDWAYGQNFGRKGYQMIMIYDWHQAQQDILADDGVLAFQHSRDNGYNLREIIVQKSKPKGVGKRGSFYLFYDAKLKRHYTIDSLGIKSTILFPKL